MVDQKNFYFSQMWCNLYALSFYSSYYMYMTHLTSDKTRNKK